MKQPLTLLVAAVLATSQAIANISPQMQAYINLLPEKALTPDFVFALAVKSSDSYQSVRAQLQATNSAALRGKAALANRVSAQFD